MSDVNSAARLGFSEAALSYNQGRPEYPTEMLGWLREKLGVYAGKNVVDLAAGTGKFTRLLRQTGANVIAIEPVDAMRFELLRGFPEVRAIAGTAQEIPLSDGSADVIVSAQAFHWFATSAALTEIHRVLKPGGTLGLVWNVIDTRVEWVAAMEDIIKPYEPDSLRSGREGRWRSAFSGAKFSDLEESEFFHQHMGSAQQVVIDRALSLSYIAVLHATEKANLVARLRALIAATPELEDETKSAVPYRTLAYSCISKA